MFALDGATHRRDAANNVVQVEVFCACKVVTTLTPTQPEGECAGCGTRLGVKPWALGEAPSEEIPEVEVLL